MNKQCQNTLQQIDSWLELDRQEKEAVLEHTWHCASCGRALSSMQNALKVLDRSAEAYSRMKFPGRMPPMPERKPLLIRFFAPAPALGLTAAAILLILVMVWSAGDRPFVSQLADRQGVFQMPRIPSMPKRSPGKTSISMSPGNVSGRLPKVERKFTPLLHRHLKMPSKPKTSKSGFQKKIGMVQTYHI